MNNPPYDENGATGARSWYRIGAMSKPNGFSRRSFLGFMAAAPLAAAFPSLSLAAGSKKIPVGLELYSVRNQLQKDLMGTVRGVAEMGRVVFAGGAVGTAAAARATGLGQGGVASGRA